jgi:UDP-N-acetylmuramoylalanine--D-glutamate ligase
MEPVVERAGVLWINDSKATNVAAALSGIESLSRPLVLLLGGKDKGEDFSELCAAARTKARHVVGYGAAGPRIAQALEGWVALTRVAGSFEDAVNEARRHARVGDVVLLSPACPSFDMFSGYAQRGEAFAALAREFA